MENQESLSMGNENFNVKEEIQKLKNKVKKLEEEQKIERKRLRSWFYGMIRFGKRYQCRAALYVNFCLIKYDIWYDDWVLFSNNNGIYEIFAEVSVEANRPFS